VKKGTCLLSVVALLFLCSCGYELITEPGITAGTAVNVTILSVPVFKNKTFEPQVPMYFTQAFSQELASSGRVQINTEGTDGTLEGTITSVATSTASVSIEGLAIQKTVTVWLDLALSQQGKVAKTWRMTDAESYVSNDINQEDFNKRAALTRVAQRMARRFGSQLVIAR
jgi:hypothetical protein